MPRSKILLLGCAVLCFATHASAAPSYMVGTWFGQGQPESKDAMYIDRMHADGSWRGEYRTCIKGKPPSDWLQEGSWVLNGDTLILKIEKVNGNFAPRNDSYKMLAHTATTQKYVSQAVNFPYTPQRVTDDFQMPSCDLIS